MAFGIPSGGAAARLGTAVLAFGLTLLTACGGSGGSAPAAGAGAGATGGGGAPATPAAATGTVGVTVGDAPADDFDQILLTVTRIVLLADDDEDGSDFVVSEEAIEIDLLALEATTELVGESAEVPAGGYCKIRLEVEQIDLVVLDTDGNRDDAASRAAEVPANGRIDLNPRGCFELEDAGALLVQIDLDARNSFALVETGAGAVRFRPLAFVDVFDGDGNPVTGSDDGEAPGAPRGRGERLSFLAGTVSRLAAPEGDAAFDLCAVQPLNGRRRDVDAEDCLRVAVADETVLFDADAAPTDFAAVTDQDPVVVAGRFGLEAGAGLFLDALLVDVGPRGGFLRRGGVIDADPVDGGFLLVDDDADEALDESDEGAEETDASGETAADETSTDDEAAGEDSNDDAPLAVTVADGALVFARNGELLDGTALRAGAEVRVLGLSQRDERDALTGIVATAIAVDVDDDDEDGDDDASSDAADPFEIEGTVQEIGDAGEFLVLPEDDASQALVCVVADEATEIVVFAEDDDSVESTPGTAASITVGVEIEARGEDVLDECFVAETIVVELPEPEESAADS